MITIQLSFRRTFSLSKLLVGQRHTMTVARTPSASLHFFASAELNPLACLSYRYSISFCHYAQSRRLDFNSIRTPLCTSRTSTRILVRPKLLNLWYTAPIGLKLLT